MDGQNLSGQLSDWSVDDLLQIMQVTSKTGSLDIAGDRKGRIHFRDGSVTGAELNGLNQGRVGASAPEIAEILFVLSSLQSGSFTVGGSDGSESDGVAVEDVLEEVEALRNLEGELSGSGLLGAESVGLVTEVEKPLTLNPADWATLVSLIKPFTFQEMEEEIGRGGAVRMFHALHRLGVAEAIVPVEDESEWLDRVADKVAEESDEPTWIESQDESEATAKHLAVDEDGDDHDGVDQVAESDEVAADLDDADDETAASADVEERELEVAGAPVTGLSAPASTTLTDGVYDEIRRLRSKVSER